MSFSTSSSVNIQFVQRFSFLGNYHSKCRMNQKCLAKFTAANGNVYGSLTLDIRKAGDYSQPLPVAVRVCHGGQKIFLRLGKSYTMEEWLVLCDYEKSGESQISLTDPDSRLMKANEGFCVGYNVQTAVDAESHMIAGFLVTNSPTDHGQLTSVASEVKADYGVDVLESTADKGYECPEDHADALANGIVPNVIQRDGSCTEQIQFDYNEATITDEQKSSTNPEDLKACLEAAVIPEAYKDFLTDAQIVEVKEYTSDVAESAVLKMTPEQMRAKALEGYFVRDAERNLVYCPQGEILRQKSIKRNGMIRYCNKLACKKCKCKCTIQKFKEADFNKDTLIKATEAKRKQLKEENKDKPKPPRMKVVKKVVRYVLHLDQNKMDNRKCLSEHPFGTMKRALGQYYFLLKGKLKVTAEMGLFCLSYNLRRAISLKGVPALIASLG